MSRSAMSGPGLLLFLGLTPSDESKSCLLFGFLFDPYHILSHSRHCSLSAVIMNLGDFPQSRNKRRLCQASTLSWNPSDLQGLLIIKQWRGFAVELSYVFSCYCSPLRESSPPCTHVVSVHCYLILYLPCPLDEKNSANWLWVHEACPGHSPGLSTQFCYFQHLCSWNSWMVKSWELI